MLSYASRGSGVIALVLLSVPTSAFVLEVYTVERLRANVLMKRNIKALLDHRDKKQGQLARYLRRKGKDDKDADSWMSHILDENDSRELPMEYWDRAADFLGVDPYHFFLPGVAHIDETERRSGSDRRQRADRRIGQDLPARPRDLDVMNIIRALPTDSLEEAIEALMKILDRALQRRRAKPASAGAHGRTVETGGEVPAPARGRKR